ncbi:MAG: ATP-binding protein, partial [Actinomycetia bacterium]|nr:ATP-binding protein [Actinomycetes bacterium]
QTVETSLAEEHTGLVVFIDEIQSADPDGLRTLAYAWQHLQSEAPDLRAAVFAAGLPNSPETLADAVTFSERLFAYRHLGYLEEQAALLALARPASLLGVRWEPDALRAAATAADGYPYFVQLVGDSVWKSAGYPESGFAITVEHVRAARAVMREDQEALYRARWLNASRLEQRVMTAMARLGDGPVSRAEVARLVNLTMSATSEPRQRLLDKGLIEAPARGMLSFPIPGFAAYIRERVSGELPPQPPRSDLPPSPPWLDQ